MKFAYPDVAPHEVPLVERFESDVLPYLERRGSYIGEAAMQGDRVCEEIIRAAHLFMVGLPQLRLKNYASLVHHLKTFERSHA